MTYLNDNLNDELKIKNEFENLNKKIIVLENELSKTQGLIDILIKHIEVLEKRSSKFSDKFKFGRFRFVKINEDLRELRPKTINKVNKFSLNDD